MWKRDFREWKEVTGVEIQNGDSTRDLKVEEPIPSSDPNVVIVPYIVDSPGCVNRYGKRNSFSRCRGVSPEIRTDLYPSHGSLTIDVLS